MRVCLCTARTVVLRVLPGLRFAANVEHRLPDSPPPPPPHPWHCRRQRPIAWGKPAGPLATTDGRPSCSRRNVEALKASTGRLDCPYRIHSLAYLALVLSYLGEFAEGRALLEEALREGSRMGALYNQSRYVAQLSAVCLMAGGVDEAMQQRARRSPWPGSTGSAGTRRSRFTSWAPSMPRPTRRK